MGCGVRGANGTLGSCDGSLPIVMPYTVVSGGDRIQALPGSIMTLCQARADRVIFLPTNSYNHQKLLAY